MRVVTRSKYVACAQIAAARAWQTRGELYGRIAFFAVVLGVFTSLWRVVAEAGMPIAAESRTLVWYLAMTEWVVLSMPMAHVGIQESIRRGDVAYQLGRPISYVVAAVAEGVGALAVRGPVLFVTGCVLAFTLTRWMPPVSTLITVGCIGFCGAVLLTACDVGIGLLAFWIGEVAPVWWVFQKGLFVFGGLMMPLTLYPTTVQTIAPYTPFPVMLSDPASLVLATADGDVGRIAVRLVIWCGLTAVALWFLFRRASSRMTVNGG